MAAGWGRQRVYGGEAGVSGEFSEIPVLDVSAIHGGTSADIARLAERFREVYSSTGFGYITGHGIPEGLVADVFAASKNFHALPAHEKMAIALDGNHRGFIPIDTSTDVNSTLAEVTKPNQSESFMMMREDAPDGAQVAAGHYLAGPNQWPELAGFRETLEAYHRAMVALGDKMVAVFERALNAEPGSLAVAFDPPTTWLRLLHYPPTKPAEDVYGSAPHCDFGFLTFLAQDDVGGLQVMTPSGVWVDAPYMPGTFVLNVGDMLHRWSNGILKSTPHRVINRSGRERYSCPFFYDPHVCTVIEPLPSCAQGGVQFAPLQFGEFLRGELEASYDQHAAEKV